VKGREKKEREKKNPRSVIPYGAVCSLFNEPNQCINDMKTYLSDEDNQALSHTTLNIQVLKGKKKTHQKHPTLEMVGLTKADCVINIKHQVCSVSLKEHL